MKGSLKGQKGPKALQVTADDIGMYINGQVEMYIRRGTPNTISTDQHRHTSREDTDIDENKGTFWTAHMYGTNL